MGPPSVQSGFSKIFELRWKLYSEARAAGRRSTLMGSKPRSWNQCAVRVVSTISFFSTECFHNSCPNHTQGTQFCDFHEEVSTLVEAEVQGVSNVMQLNAAFLHLTYIFNCSSEGVSNLLYCFSTAIGVSITVDENSAQLRSISFSKFNGFSHFIIQSIQRGFGFTGFYQLADRVAANNTAQGF